MTVLDKEFYCVLGDRINGNSHLCSGLCSDCPLKRRIHPTLEQYKEEYGEEWKGAVPVYADYAPEIVFVKRKTNTKEGYVRILY